MINYLNEVIMADGRMEIVQSHERDFPYAAMESELGKYPNGCTPWHWHEHFEFGIMEKGRMVLRTQRGEMQLQAGEGYFLNANVLHRSMMHDRNEDVCLHAQLFLPELISGTGLIARKYVSTVEKCVELEAVKLNGRNEAHARILAECRAAFAAAEEDGPAYEMDVSAHLCAAWGELYRMVRPEIERAQGQPREDVQRVKTMLSYIYEHYRRGITVREIADAAGICERECFRCFKQVLNTTPMLFLTNHRINMAARALAETNMSVGQIAEDCGFANSGYFGKVFRQKIKCTPLEFRRKNG